MEGRSEGVEAGPRRSDKITPLGPSFVTRVCCVHGAVWFARAAPPCVSVRNWCAQFLD